jgi:phthiocerol/phenolphthiocerol synthesis type-I polyketide synthase E
MSSAAVAVVGMALRLPGANTPEQFWANLRAGADTISRWQPESPEPTPGQVYARGQLSDIEMFDAGFFGISPREAQLMDPQHRLFLECAYEALDRAGYPPGSTSRRIGVFAGTGRNAYLLRHLLGYPALLADMGPTALLVASEKDHVATRVAHKLNLHGPVMTVQTSCSTSLVAVHQAVQALRHGEADLMLAGGAAIDTPQDRPYRYSMQDILSPDGYCRAFSDDAGGTVPANGVAVVVLKRADEAYRDRDTVYAVIRGSAINNDGSRKVGYAAPSIAGQVEVISRALRDASLASTDIDYIETHGTGTELGDAIEIEALDDTYGVDRDRACLLGTLKPNVGHTDIASGAASLIKACLALHHAELPPSIHYRAPSQQSRLGTGNRLAVNAGLTGWPRSGTGVPARCAVSSFGIGGANAHMVLEEAVRAAPDEPAEPAERWVLPVSAKTTAACADSLTALSRWLAGPDRPRPADVAFTLAVGRPQLAYRSYAVAGPTGQVEVADFSPPHKRDRRVTPGLLFTGQGTQYPGMGAELCHAFAAFRQTVQECASLARAHLDVDIVGYLRGAHQPADPAAIEQMPLAQVALFTLELAVARLLIARGFVPQVMLGHSVGEYAAACVAGSLDVPDAMALLTARSRILGSVEGGAMLSVRAGEATVRPYVDDDISLAAVNSTTAVVLAGRRPALLAVSERLARAGLEHRMLRIATAGHSALLDGRLDDFGAVAERCAYREPAIPVISSIDGRPVSEHGGFSAGYWVRHMRATVDFAAAARRVAALPGPVLVEVGPGATLSQFVQQASTDGRMLAVAAVPDADEAGTTGLEVFLHALGTAWSAGVPVDLSPTGPAGRVPLPTYPFQRSRHWLEPVATASVDSIPTASAQPASAAEPALALLAPADQPPADGPGSHAVVIERLGALWRHVLGVPTVSLEDNFYSLGGESLALVRVIGAIRDQFGVTVPLRTVAARPTFGWIASMIENELRRIGGELAIATPGDQVNVTAGPHSQREEQPQ